MLIFSSLRNLSVRSKVIASFACVVAFTAALGAFSIKSLTDVYAAGEEIRTNWLISTVYLGKVAAAAERFRQVQGQYILETAEDRRSADLKQLENIKGEISDAEENYLPTVTTDIERKLYNAFHQKWAVYVNLQGQLAELASKRSGLKAAIKFYTETSRAPFEDFQNALNEDLEFQIAGANESGNKGAEVFDAAGAWTWRAVGLVSVLSLLIGILLTRAICTPLRLLTETILQLAQGNLDVEIPSATRNDEIGRLAGATQSFKNQLAAAEKSKAEQTETIVSSIGSGLDSLAKGDLTHRIASDLTGPFAKLKDDFNGALNRLQNTISTIIATTSGISSGASEISQAADDLSKRTEQQAASLEETAAALEEISATIKKTAQNAKDTSAIVKTAKSAAEEGGQVVDTAIRAMGEIEQSSKKITDIIGVIDEIAFQTNLLALNAGVEAARAGDAGKGFAVVASEVRALAQRSSEAAKQIKTLIKTSGEQVNSGVKLVGQSGASLKRIADQVIEINSLVSEMALGAQQQATGIEQVAAAVTQMDQVTQQNAAMVEESTAASRNLATETTELSNLVTFFRVAASEAPPATKAQDKTAAKVVPMKTSSARPKPSRTVAKAGGRSSHRAATALKVEPAAEAVEDDWQEF